MKHRNEEQTIKKFLKNLQENANYEHYFINKEYQREYVWKNRDMKQELIISIFKNNPIGTIIIWNNENKKRKEIVDGQQRIYTIYKFFNNEFPLNNDFIDKLLKIKEFRKNLDEIINGKSNYLFLENSENKQDEIKKAKEILSKEKNNLFFKDFPNEIINEFFYDYNLIITQIEGWEEEISEYFVVLQNQESLKAGEIINAYNSKEIYEIFDKKKFIEKFSKVFNFENNRQDLIKFLYFIILINQNKILFGASDKTLLKKIKEFNIRELNTEINFIKKIKNLSQELINIKNLKNKNEIFEKSSTKNALKIFLLSYFFSNSNFYNNLDLIEKMKISREIANLTKKIKSSDEEEKKKLINQEYWKNIMEIEKILVRSHNKEKIINVINTNFDKLFENIEFNNYYLKIKNNYLSY